MTRESALIEAARMYDQATNRSTTDLAFAIREAALSDAAKGDAVAWARERADDERAKCLADVAATFDRLSARPNVSR
jgi:hypothetical protein